MNTTERLWAYHKAKIEGKSSEVLERMIDQIARLNDKLAISRARRASATCDLPLDDLMQLARIGLIKAIKKIDPTRNVALSSFAVPYCDGEIKHFLRDHTGIIKAPRRWREKSDEVRAVQRKLAAAGRIVEIDEVAIVGLGLPQHKWAAIHHATQNKPLTVLDETLQIAAEPEESIEEQEEREAIRAALLQRLGKLEPQTKRCIVEFFWADLSEEVIAKRQGVSVAVVKSLIDKGLEQLRGEIA